LAIEEYSIRGSKAAEILFTKAQARYESRAYTLINDHPLDLQINLSIGVVKEYSLCA
jgi:hypothetical protein